MKVKKISVHINYEWSLRCSNAELVSFNVYANKLYKITEITRFLDDQKFFHVIIITSEEVSIDINLEFYKYI